MDVEFERWRGAAVDELPVEIDADDVIDRQRAADRCGRIDVKGSLVAPGAAVPAVVDDVRARQHADRIDQLLFERGRVGRLVHFHGMTET
jgi:hypothetical protein